jgi:hypothetical protein
MKFLAENQILLCSQKKTCCPIITKVSDDEYTITDDYKGKVQLNRTDMSELKKALEHFNENI